MTERAQAIELIQFVPDEKMSVILEVIKHFIPVDIDNIATPEDIAAIEQGRKEYAAGQTISHNDIDWD